MGCDTVYSATWDETCQGFYIEAVLPVKHVGREYHVPMAEVAKLRDVTMTTLFLERQFLLVDELGEAYCLAFFRRTGTDLVFVKTETPPPRIIDPSS